MKNTLIRFLTLMTLATSISAFAVSDKAAKDEKCNADAKSETAAASAAHKARKAARDEEPSDNSPEKSRERLIQQQNKQWEHDTQNLVAG